MAKKTTKKTYVCTRRDIESRLVSLADSIDELETRDTTPNDLDDFLSGLVDDLRDLATESVETF